MGESDIVAVGERAVACKEAEWADHDRYSFAQGDSHMEQTGMLVGNFEFNP